jgi:hypothetical protein
MCTPFRHRVILGCDRHGRGWFVGHSSTMRSVSGGSVTSHGTTDVVMLRDMGGDNRDSSMPRILYMVVEHFKSKDAVAVYRRFRDRGRLAPEGLLCAYPEQENSHPPECFQSATYRSGRKPPAWNELLGLDEDFLNRVIPVWQTTVARFPVPICPGDHLNYFRIADDPPRISSSVPDAPLLFSPLTRLRGQLARGVTDFFRSLFRCQGRKVWRTPCAYRKVSPLASEISELRGTL